MSEKLALVFPGQGAQTVGMADASLTNSEVKEVFDIADKIFSEYHQGKELKNISAISQEGPEDELKRTLYTQPAILTLSIALAAQIKKNIAEGKIAKPLYLAGHSLGEFAALYAAGVLSIEDVIKLVVKRADLMEQAPEGAMTAIVGMEQAKLDEMVEAIDGASVANYNSPDQVVATGTKEAMKTLGEQVEAFATENSLRVKVIPLVVGGAFHSPLMQAASEEFAKVIDECEFKDAEIPVIQNTTATPVTKADEIKANLKLQMTGSVRWTETVKTLITETESIFEVGPGKVLSGLVRKQERRFNVKNISSLADLENLLMASA